MIVPKVHYQDVFDIDEHILQKIASTAKMLAQTVKESLNATGVNLINASGKDAEQSVFHFHLHLVPRYEHDGLHMNDWWQTKVQNFSSDELQHIADEIKKNV